MLGILETLERQAPQGSLEYLESLGFGVLQDQKEKRSVGKAWERSLLCGQTEINGLLMSGTAESLKGAPGELDSTGALLQLGESGIYFVFSVEERQKRVGALEEAGGPFAMPPGLATSPSSQALPVSDQGDGCTACPSLQGALTDVSGLPGKPGPKGEPGPEGVGRPGKPVSAIGSSCHPSLPVCCVLHLPNTPKGIHRFPCTF